MSGRWNRLSFVEQMFKYDPGATSANRQFAGLCLAILFALSGHAQRIAQPVDDTNQEETEAYIRRLESDRTQKLAGFLTRGAPPFKTEKARKTFGGLDWFPVDPAWKVTARVELFESPDTLLFPTSAGTTKSFIRYARLIFEAGGRQDSLEAYRSLQNISHPEYGKLLFVPFTDMNSGGVCYGGGRYLDPVIPEGNLLILDFNEAYNPYCAYSDGWFCPIPPRENDLRMAVNAGEKDYPGEKKGASMGKHQPSH